MPSWILGTAASAWGIVMAIAPVLQIIRMLRRRSAEDISLGYFALLVPGFILWVAYGIATADIFLTAPNALATLTALTVIGLTLWMRRAAGNRPENAPPSERTAA
ncbi:MULTISPECIES: SemiSWEET family sugar transporter [Microbacterium]|uniref:PQ-loop repeat-containing protein n=1 Tax=Microbacterium wangchenii TaxID=2541726 RepID=A0ABX5SZ57_9MICO|nr:MULTISPECIES: SemiSWEET family transporter [Microbacterium]MCK6066132.1 PQ-loop repeat-containing protein [Microbacterium sp. EYE_512]QBR90412.1 PQ-loop repeat-containing protein [Microbacterium wangchenii]TFV84781.1 PQ-loop repeat-containing protein [Microbacterium sp. dk485]TXK14437.1 PQ-loop repeat-containing protein [Microbacterium wangchenii]